VEPFYFGNMTQRNLFGKREKKQLDAFEQFLVERDRNTLMERAERLRFTEEIYPHDLFIMTDNESAMLLEEAKLSYVNGEFISTMLLCQAYIDRRFQLYFEAVNLKKQAKGSMEQKIQYFREHNLMPDFVLSQIDLLRKKRNPFAHLKAVEHEFNMTWRTLDAVRAERPGHPQYLVYEDAKIAISLMYLVASRISRDVDMARLRPPDE